MLRHCPVLLALLALVAPLSAADGSVTPYGTGSAGSNQLTPRAWVAGQPYVDNAQFRFTVDRAVPGSFAVLLLSNRPGQIPAGSFTLWLDAFSSLFMVAGTAPVLPDGTAAVGFPLADANLEGVSLFAQWVVVEVPSLALSASDAVQATLTRGPLAVGVGASSIDTYDHTGTGGVLSQFWGQAPAGAALSRDGRLAFFAGSFGSPVALEIYDATQQPMPRLVNRVLNAPAGGLALHHGVRRAYVATISAIDWYDADPTSPTFGAYGGSIAGLGSQPGLAGVSGMSISQDGRRLVVATLGLFVPRNLIVVDVDPASATRDQLVRVLTPNTNQISGLFLGLETAPDGQTAYVITQASGGGRVAEIALLNGALVRQATISQAPAAMAMDPRGRHIVVSTGGTTVFVVDMATFVSRSFTTYAGMSGLALSADGTEVVGCRESTSYGFENYRIADGQLLWTGVSPNQSMRVVMR